MKRILWAGAGLAGVALAAAFAHQRYVAGMPEPPPDPATLERLEQHKRALQSRLRELTQDDQGLSRAPKASVLIGVPTSFTESLVAQTVSGLSAQIRVTLKNLKVAKQDELKAKTPLGRMKLGDFKLDVTIHEVHALLKPGKPDLRFGGNRLGVKLPVSLASGAGRATLHFRWDGRKLAGAVCGDLDLTREVEGSVAPVSFRLNGEFLLQAQGDSLVATPRFPDVKLKLQVEPAASTWEMLDELVKQQGAVCRAVLRKVDVAQKLKELVGRGFPVTLSRKLWKPLRLPAGLQQQVDVPGERSALLSVKPIGLLVVPERVWYGANVEVRPALSK